MSDTPTIHIVARNKDRILFDGDVFAVTSYNDKGEFDVLPEHENFISTIKNKLIIHKTRKEKEEFQIENGIIRVTRDRVYAYVNFSA